MAAANPQNSDPRPGNAELAGLLRETADLLEAQGAGKFRVQAYRNAAETVGRRSAPLWRALESEGTGALTRLPGVGRSIADALSHLIRTGSFPLLDRLRGGNEPERLFATVADIGPKLAERIHERLGVETLWELEAAANDGRLAQVPGIGPKRLRAVRETLAGRFRQGGGAKQAGEPTQLERETPVAELLDVDRQYRTLAAKQRLPLIAPRRFNPTGQAWLPILHTERDSRHYTAMFSNTARAHELGTTHDWVVIYRDDQGNHGQWTVITSVYGKLRGRRIVCGREPECGEHYARQDARREAAPAYQQTLLPLKQQEQEDDGSQG